MARLRKTLTVAIIIPVYNEEHRIVACLQAIAAQTDKPDEVIVVDNNCTDQTIALAQKFDFVRVVREKRQGKAHARNAGFNAAKSDILGRIDADSELLPNWVATVRDTFETNSSLTGITGPSYSLFLPRIRWPRTTLWSRLYFLWTEIFYRVPVMWGANMAIRRTAWQDVRTKVCTDDAVVHEDIDVSIVLQAYGGTVRYVPSLRFVSYSQAYHYFPKLLYYTKLRHTGRRYHQQQGLLASLPYTLTKLQSAVIYGLGWPIIGYFFAMSLLVWPLDAAMNRLGRLKSWLS